ncbi:MAG TPA: DoxX family membrane protein [Acidimicrobiia bacterium]|nr:DoxX family membrane protein [Acidimicrobiia bacterium]
MNKPASPPAAVAESWWTRIRRADQRVRDFLRNRSIPLLRLSLGVVFVWFGVLKVAGMSPVETLIASVVYWVDPSWFIPVLGIFEVVVGLGLLAAKLMRVTLFLFALQMLGTFLVLVIRPDIAFQEGNPLLLTVEGEFVVKNLVLLAAGLVVGAQVPALPPWEEIEQKVAQE